MGASPAGTVTPARPDTGRHRPGPGPRRTARQLFLAAAALVAVMLASTLLPWFTSAETPSWTPYSRWLDLGWAPGTRDFGLVMAALAVVTVVCLVLVTLRPGRVGGVVALGLTVGLLAVALVESAAHLSVDPGPDLHFDWGAVLGCAALTAAVGCTAVATYAAWDRGEGAPSG